MSKRRKRHHFASSTDRLIVLAVRHTGAGMREIGAAVGVSAASVCRICESATPHEQNEALTLYQRAYRAVRFARGHA